MVFDKKKITKLNKGLSFSKPIPLASSYLMQVMELLKYYRIFNTAMYIYIYDTQNNGYQLPYFSAARTVTCRQIRGGKSKL